MKTPDTTHVESFRYLFPEQRLLILVRDGRSVVESGVRSFGWDYDEATFRWRRSARRILKFVRENDGVAYRLVRYEDLYLNLEDQLRDILTFVDLDTGVYDFEAAANLPVRGSSDVRGNSGDQVHWKPVAKDEHFNPLRRWQSWSRAQHERFNWIAGDAMIQLGYDLVEFDSNRSWWTARNRAKDLKRRIGARMRRKK